MKKLIAKIETPNAKSFIHVYELNNGEGYVVEIKFLGRYEVFDYTHENHALWKFENGVSYFKDTFPIVEESIMI